MKYNLGCGADYKHGWVNCDRYAAAKPDVVMDLEQFPWPIDDGVADEILLSHVLEQLGGHADVFLGVMTEIYRISAPGAKIVIRAPDPRHDDFHGNPSNQRPVSPGLFEPFDLALNEKWQAGRLPGTPLAKYLGIDLPIISVERQLDQQWHDAWQSKLIDDAALVQSMRANNNVVRSCEIVLQARKPFKAGRSLSGLDALVVRRAAGMGDALMALSALSAVHRATGLPVYIETAPEFVGLAQACPEIAGVFVDFQAVVEFFERSGLKEVRFVDWSPAVYGISRLHQVDAFLMSLGLTLPDADKGLAPAVARIDAVRSHLDALPPGRRRVVLHPGMTDPNRTWSRAFWRDLAAELVEAGDAVIVIGATRGIEGRSVAALDQPSVLDLTDALTLEGTLALLRSCDVLISGDSGPIQIAGATDIAIVGLYSVVSGGERLPYRSGSTVFRAVAVAPSCPFHPCYGRLNDPDAVAAFCVEEGLSPVDTPALFSRWCVNPQRYACVEDPNTSRRVRDALERLSPRAPQRSTTSLEAAE